AACGCVTDLCCAMKSPTRSPTPLRWKTRSGTCVRPSPPQPSNSDEQIRRALGFECEQEPGEMREVRRNHAARYWCLCQLSLAHSPGSRCWDVASWSVKFSDLQRGVSA